MSRTCRAPGQGDVGGCPPALPGRAAGSTSTLTPAQEIAQHLQIDRAAWQVGRIAAICGAPWRCPEGLDLLSWALGYNAGQRLG